VSKTRPSTRPRISRRTFLKGAGVTAAAAGAAVACAPTNVGPSTAATASAAAAQQAAVSTRPLAGGPGSALMRLTVNGHQVETGVDPSWTLADLLRYQLGLTGTKLACDRGECGSCTVVMDGRAVLACMTVAAEAAGHTVLTVEGLTGPDGELNPLQRSFYEYGAVQCGFCTPGMLMSATALLAVSPRPSADDARLAISGNLCRCTGYTKVVEAIVRAGTA